jgi:hypothetical protein
MSVLYTVNIIYFLKLYSVNIHTVWQSIQAQTCCSYTYHLFLSDLTLNTSNFVTSHWTYLAWSEWHAHSGQSISVWRFHAGWLSCYPGSGGFLFCWSCSLHSGGAGQIGNPLGAMCWLIDFAEPIRCLGSDFDPRHLIGLSGLIGKHQ